MAKPSPSGKQPDLKSKPTTKHSYRVDRLSTYEYQGFKITRNSDGTYTEELFGKPSLLELVMRKVYRELALESNEIFQAIKKLS